METTPGVFYQVFSGGEYKVRGRKRNVGRPEQSDPDQETGTSRGCKNREIIQNNSTRCHSCARQGYEMFADEVTVRLIVLKNGFDSHQFFVLY